MVFNIKMFSLPIRLLIVMFLIVIAISCVRAQDRKITSHINPGCYSCTNDQTLVYIVSEGSHDTIHQIWDFTRGIPSIIFAIGSINSSLSIQWDGQSPRNIHFNENPKYSFAAALDRIYEFNDLDDDGAIDIHCPQKLRPLSYVSWKRSHSVLTDKEVMIKMRGKFMYSKKWISDTVDIKLDLIPFKDYAVDLPHLIHTANSTLVDVSLINMTSSPEYNQSRFAVHLTLVSTDSASDTMHLSIRKSLDDEHTPGVFEIFEIKTAESYRKDDGGFIQFRPVGYTQAERSVTTSTIAHLSDFSRASLQNLTTLVKFYKYYANPPLVQDVFVSFGEGGDGYYKQHNYTAWSFTIGYGEPPIETFSLFVILVISIGLSMPIALAVSGAAYVVVRRCRQRNAPRRLSEHE